MEQSTIIFEDIVKAVLTFHDRRDAFKALVKVNDQLSDSQFWALFRLVIERTEILVNSQSEIRRLLTAERLNSDFRLGTMSEDECGFLKRSIQRNKPLKVYRGGCVSNVTGYSYTEKKSVAAQYANASGQNDSCILHGTMDPKKVIMYIKSQNTLICFPEDIDPVKVEDVPVSPNVELAAARNLILLQGYAAASEITEAEFISNRIDKGEVTTESVIDFGEKAIECLSKFDCFKERIQTVQSMITAAKENEDAFWREE